MITHNPKKKRPYRADIRVEIDDKPVRLRKSFYTQKQAKEWISIQQVDALRGTLKILRKKDRTTLRQAGDRILSDLRGRRAENTVERYKFSLQHACGILGEEIRFDDIGKSELERYVTERRRAGKNPRTINGELQALQQILALAGDCFKTKAGWRPPRIDPLPLNQRGRSRTLTNDEFERLMQQLEKRYPVVADVVLLCSQTGARYSEVLSITWGDVWFDSQHHPHGSLTLIGAKNKKRRTIPLTTAARELLERRRVEIGDASKWVFPSPKSDTHYVDIRKQLKTACIAANVPYGRDATNGIVFHDLRRTAVTIARTAGMRIEDAAEFFGHTPAVMLNIYSQPQRQGLDDIARVLDRGDRKSVQTDEEERPENEESSKIDAIEKAG